MTIARKTIAALDKAYETNPRYAGWGGRARLARDLGVTPSYLSKLANKPRSGVSEQFAIRVESVLGLEPGSLSARQNLSQGASKSQSESVPSTGMHIEGTPDSGPESRPGLVSALSYHAHSRRWSAATVAAVRASSASDRPPPEWAELLDEVEARLTGVLLPKTRRN